MNNLLKNPAFLIVGGVLLLVAVLIGGKGSGATYAVAGGPTAADIKARADAQAVTDRGLSDQRGAILNGILGYDKQKKEFQTATLKLRTDASTTRYQTDAAVRLGLAGIDSQNRAIDSAQVLGLKRTEADVQVAQGQQAVESQNGILNFFGNLISGIFGLFMPGPK